MKIVFFISHLSNDGPVHALLSILKGMNIFGLNEITVLTLSSPKKNILQDEFEKIGVNIKNININPFNLIVSLLKIRLFLYKGDFDIAGATCIRADALLAASSVGMKKLVTVTTVQNIPTEDLGYLYPGWRGRLASWMHYQILKLYKNNIICCSNTVSTHLRDRIGITGKVILNPISAPVLLPSESSPKPVVVFAASLTARKNPFEALSFVFNSLEPLSFSFLVYGSGLLEEKLHSAYRDRQEIRWCGFTNNLSDVFSRSTVYISSSQSEGFPLTPQLALVSGCPCVLSDIPQHREMADMSKFVYLYRLGDQIDFSRALKLALSADREAVQNDGLILIRKISPETSAFEILKFYKSLIKVNTNNHHDSSF